MKMKRRLLYLAQIMGPLAFISCTLAACGSARGAPDGKQDEEKEPVAQVVTAPVVRKPISETLTAYGAVTAEPGTTQTLARTFETRVRRVLVAPGQPVQKGQPLLELQASPATMLQLRQAENAARTAHRDLEQTRERFNLKLATGQDLSQAEKTATDADLQLASLRGQGIQPQETATAPAEGVVARIGVQDGQLVAAGAPLVEIASTEAIQVKLGMEPEDVNRVVAGQKVTLSLVNNPSADAVEGHVRLITRQVDPATRLVYAYIALPKDSGLLLDSYVVGRVETASHEGLVAPRQSILDDHDQPTLFIVRDGKAQRVPVRLGLQNDDEVELAGTDVKPGEPVVVHGYRELIDGMRVEVAQGRASR
ncbi:MAG: efflux RND transporter periplasmic adaptor subunit [Verrucomicrobia bacterium]|nr:efflux RND transporter periplasmic adaptor subunit [Verrucomicrobiota bacterium]